MRVGQHAHVKHIVGVQRYTAFEGKGLKHQGQPARRGRHQGLEISLQLRGADDAGVDDLGLFTYFREQFAFVLDRFNQCPVRVGGHGARQRVHAAGFRKSSHQRVGTGVQKNRFDRHALSLQGQQLLGYQRQRCGAAHIHRNGHAAGFVFKFECDKTFEQLWREVVHTVVASVFQGVQRD